MNKAPSSQPGEEAGGKERLSTKNHPLLAAAITVSMLCTSVGCAVNNKLRKPQLPDNKPNAGEVDTDYAKRKKEAEQRMQIINEYVVQLFTLRVQKLVSKLGFQLFRLDIIPADSEVVRDYRNKTIRLLKVLLSIMNKEYKKVSPESDAGVGLSQLIEETRLLIETYSRKWGFNS